MNTTTWKTRFSSLSCAGGAITLAAIFYFLFVADGSEGLLRAWTYLAQISGVATTAGIGILTWCFCLAHKCSKREDATSFKRYLIAGVSALVATDLMGITFFASHDFGDTWKVLAAISVAFAVMLLVPLMTRIAGD